jgi:hypothetical protein
MAGFDEPIFAAHVKNRVLLSCKRSFGQIFCRRRRTHRYFWNAAEAIAQTAISLNDCLMNLRRQGSIEHESARLATSRIKCLDVGVIKVPKQLSKAHTQAIRLKEQAICSASGCKTIYGAHTLGRQAAE